ncbi:MAG: DNA polymerase Y family protein, partial [Rhodanobacteraceae bacterium]
LGDEALRGLRCVADHRPARAWRFASALEMPVQPAAKRTRNVAPRKRSAEPTLVIHTGLRPFWLLAKPIVLRVAPARILAGPERIESGWWDDRDKRRDYYIIETAQGQRAWAFVPAGSMDQWTLHGWFA